MNETLQEREYASVPTEGKWFRVKPLDIDQSLFKEKRKDPSQERTRQYILEAFAEMKKNSKYTKPFKTLMPEKTWSSKTVIELKEMASVLGDHMADWVEQALEWAQRITNGECWLDICNKGDKANWYRLIVGKDEYANLIGGSYMHCDLYPASDFDNYGYYDNTRIYQGIPLVISYDI